MENFCVGSNPIKKGDSRNTLVTGVAIFLLNNSMLELHMILKKLFALLSLAVSALLFSSSAMAEKSVDPGYFVQPGDALFVSVWKEEDMQREVLVGPDGTISFPLAGDIKVKGLTVAQIRYILEQSIKKYIPDPSVSVSIIKVAGNKVYVVGQVNRPGEFVVDRPIDVMQALTMAGGTTVYADLKRIKILRRDENTGEQTVYNFDYKKVSSGKALDQNIILKSGDTVMVP